MIKFNDTMSTEYKNAEIVIVVEEDVITTANVYIDKQCVVCEDITTESGGDVEFKYENYNEVVNMMKAEVDKMWEETFALATANR